MSKELANELHLKTLAYLQDFNGFQKWWESIPLYQQAKIEDGLIVGIERHLSAHAVDADICERCGYPKDTHPRTACWGEEPGTTD